VCFVAVRMSDNILLIDFNDEPIGYYESQISVKPNPHYDALIQPINQKFSTIIVDINLLNCAIFKEILDAFYLYYQFNNNSNRFYATYVMPLNKYKNNENYEYYIIMCHKVIKYSKEYHHGAKINDLINKFMREHYYLSYTHKKIMECQMRQIIDLYGDNEYVNSCYPYVSEMRL